LHRYCAAVADIDRARRFEAMIEWFADFADRPA
jgi:hypothetical protein